MSRDKSTELVRDVESLSRNVDDYMFIFDSGDRKCSYAFC